MGYKRKHHILRTVLVIVLVLIVACAAVGFEFYKQAEEVKTEANNVMVEITTLKQEIKSGDTTEAAATASLISTTAQSMKTTTDGVLWQLASKLPYVGTDVQNARTLTDVLNNLSSDVLVPVADTINDAGGLNLSSATSLSEMSSELSVSIKSAQSTIDSLPEGNISEVNNAVARAQELVDSTNLSSDLSTDIISAL